MYILKSLIPIVFFMPSIFMKAFDLSAAECNSFQLINDREL